MRLCRSDLVVVAVVPPLSSSGRWIIRTIMRPHMPDSHSAPAATLTVPLERSRLMQYHNTMRVYAQEEPPFRHNLFGSAGTKVGDPQQNVASTARASPGSVELKVDDFVPKSFSNTLASRPSPHLVSPIMKKDDPSFQSRKLPSLSQDIPRDLPTAHPTETSKVKDESPPSSAISTPKVTPMVEESTSHGDLVGRKVKKFFDGFGWYYGSVTSRWESQDYGEQFHILYNDGDSEDLTREALLPLLLPASPVRTPILSTTSSPSLRVNGNAPQYETASPNETARRRKLMPFSKPNPQMNNFARVVATPHMPPLPTSSDPLVARKFPFPRSAESSLPSARHPLRPSSANDHPEVLDLTGSDDEGSAATHMQKQSMSTIPTRHAHPAAQPPIVYASARRKRSAEDEGWRPLPTQPRLPSVQHQSPQHRPSLLYQANQQPMHHRSSLRMPSMIQPSSRSLPSVGHGSNNDLNRAAQLADPLSAFNAELYYVVKEIATTEQFGPTLVNILKDMPHHPDYMDVSRLAQNCRQRRYHKIIHFMVDVVKIPTTAQALYPDEAQFFRRSETFTSLVTQRVRALTPVLQTLEFQLN
ncbi:Aste57867_22452 [Aphanomyces stellatus]|uniref:Aste57867_22452 protein n=1 Tax=Aphanomyces stellatus TaxID=120398 RepID=A0A485LM02_9STRA|nr:hypothetical protein As57867_022382 [Aphanomyces stellatus]VFT99112.1 Aste57867_22452 [Aphanomyces stellatus]